jgi:hypothetical protein
MPDTVATVRLAPADESSTLPTWKIQTDSEFNSDLDAQQRTRFGEFILSAAIGSPGTTSVFLVQQMTLDALTENGPVISTSYTQVTLDLGQALTSLDAILVLMPKLTNWSTTA